MENFSHNVLAQQLLGSLIMRGFCESSGYPFYVHNLHYIQEVLLDEFADLWKYIPTCVLQLNQRTRAADLFKSLYLQTLIEPHRTNVDTLLTQFSRIEIDSLQTMQLTRNVQYKRLQSFR